MPDRTLGVGVIGLGFMGRTHLRAWRDAARAGFANRIVAVADRDAERRAATAKSAGNLAQPDLGDLLDAGVARHADPKAVLADPAVDVVSICTHTDTHVDLALAALAADKHVLVEKPVAIAAADVARLRDAARRASTLCMPAMCMRFWPAWDWMRDRIADGSLGACTSAVFRRLGTRPAWGGGFYADTAKSGGALVDLHIHDADFVLWCFGAPERVQAFGDRHHLTAVYAYSGAARHVVAEAGWDHAPGFPFRMRATLVFERATVDFDLACDPQLLVYRDGRAEPVALPATDGYDGEVRHLHAAITSGSRELRATLDDAVALARLLETEASALRDS